MRTALDRNVSNMVGIARPAIAHPEFPRVLVDEMVADETAMSPVYQVTGSNLSRKILVETTGDSITGVSSFYLLTSIASALFSADQLYAGICYSCKNLPEVLSLIWP